MAPSNAFISQTYNANTTGGTVQHSLAIPTDDATTLKNRFYLDKLYQIQTSSGTTFIGGCKVGSSNYEHHNIDRVGALRSRGESGSEVVYYTDAGLNTMGNAVLTGFTGDDGGAGSLTLSVDFLSAFYVNTDTYGITVDKYIVANDDSVTSTSYEKIAGYFLAEKESDTGSIWLAQDLKIPFNKKSVTLYVKGFIENNEGRFTTRNRYEIVSDYNKASYDFDRSNPSNLKFTVSLAKPLKKASMEFTTDIYIDYYDEDGFLQTYLYDDGYILLYQGQSSGDVGVSLPSEIDPNLIDAVLISPLEDEFSEISYYDQTV